MRLEWQISNLISIYLIAVKSVLFKVSFSCRLCCSLGSFKRSLWDINPLIPIHKRIPFTLLNHWHLNRLPLTVFNTHFRGVIDSVHPHLAFCFVNRGL